MAKIVKKCKKCDITFSLIPAKADRIYCSIKCYHSDRKVTFVRRICQHCNNEFEFPQGKRDAKYCSRECMSKAFQYTEKRVCPGCEKTFSIQPSHKNEYCSRICKDAHRKRQAIRTNICVQCYQPFTYQHVNTRPPQRYCSVECQQKGHRKRVTKECPTCKIVFEVQQHRAAAQYCSMKCSDKARWITKICPFCKNEFDIWNCRKHQVCCSRRCAQKLKKRTYIESKVAEWLVEFNITFIEQQRIGSFTCDFVVNTGSISLVIETDGEYWHSLPKVIERDRRKNKYLQKRGYKILRLPENNIRNNPEWCKLQILSYFESRPA